MKKVKINSGSIVSNIITDVSKSQKNKPSAVSPLFVKSSADANVSGLTVKGTSIFDNMQNGTYYVNPYSLPTGSQYEVPTVVNK